MKKIFTLLALAITTLTATAADYKDELKVKIGEEVISQNASISVTEQANGLYTLTLRDFSLTLAGNTMPVGNIVIADAKAVQKDGVRGFSLTREITISEGSDKELPWIGPSLGNVPIKITAEFTPEKLYANLDILTTTVGRIGVEFGKLFSPTFYVPQNAGFEEFVGKGAQLEPKYWHSFGSAGGSLAGTVNKTQKIFESTDIRPNSMGSKSVEVRASSIFFFVANGNLTSGRVIAGSISAANAANHNLSDPTATDVDQSDAPYVQPFFGRPDSLVVWVKFTPGKATDKASLRATIHDNTPYKDPTVGTPSNVVAVAEHTVGQTNGKWERISIPFVYTDNDVSPANILFSFSTNATPGSGSGSDKLWLDDIEMIYEKHPLVITGISNVAVAPRASTTAVGIYSLDGRRLSKAPAKGIFIEKKTEEKAVKTIF